MKFNIIYADPPWSFKTWSEKGMGRSPKYPTLSLVDISYLNIPSIAADNCVLFLWATAPMMPQALEVMDGWSFKYKTIAFTWIKQTKHTNDIFRGMGYYTRSNAEYCLLGTRGKPLPRLDKSISSVVMTTYERHSKKPEAVRGRIESLFGWYPSVELFARDKRVGWVCLGNEVTGNDIRVDIDNTSRM